MSDSLRENYRNDDYDDPLYDPEDEYMPFWVEDRERRDMDTNERMER